MLAYDESRTEELAERLVKFSRIIPRVCIVTFILVFFGILGGIAFGMIGPTGLILGGIGAIPLGYVVGRVVGGLLNIVLELQMQTLLAIDSGARVQKR
jgi:hypothetical protein